MEGAQSCLPLDTAFSLVQIAQRNGTPPSAPQRKRLGTPASAGTRGRRPRNRATRLNATAHPVRERRPPAGTRGWPSFICRLTPPADHRYRPDPPSPTRDIDRSPPGMAHRLGTPASAGTARRRRAAGRTGSCNGASLSARTPGRPRGAPTLDIDRSWCRRSRISTGPPAADPGYRPELPSPTWISTGALVADPGYRPELASPTSDIDRSPRRRPGYRPEPPRHGAPAWNAGFSRHSPPQAGGGTDRVMQRRLSLGADARSATRRTDPRYRPELASPTLDIDRSRVPPRR